MKLNLALHHSKPVILKLLRAHKEFPLKNKRLLKMLKQYLTILPVLPYDALRLIHHQNQQGTKVSFPVMILQIGITTMIPLQMIKVA